MGGALATLCTFEVLERGLCACSKTNLYTFGAPAAGNRSFVSALEYMLLLDKEPARAIMCVNNDDPIPVMQVRSVFRFLSSARMILIY